MVSWWNIAAVGAGPIPSDTTKTSAAVSFHTKINTDIKLDEFSGKTSTLSDYLQHGPVYVTFWALWCEPCKQELRVMKKFVNDNPELPFTLLAINLDSPKSLAKVKAYVKSQEYPFPVALDPNMQIFQSFNGQQLPFSVFLASDGSVVSTRTGYLAGDEKEIAEEIMKLVHPVNGVKP